MKRARSESPPEGDHEEERRAEGVEHLEEDATGLEDGGGHPEGVEHDERDPADREVPIDVRRGIPTPEPRRRGEGERGAREEDEGRRAEVRDPAREELPER